MAKPVAGVYGPIWILQMEKNEARKWAFSTPTPFFWANNQAQLEKADKVILDIHLGKGAWRPFL